MKEKEEKNEPLKPTSFKFKEETKRLLNELCKIHDRNATNMLEVLIKDAAKKAKIPTT